jgi:pilus assembly protein CpaB
MRLKTISVDASKSAAGLLSPGDRVDIQIYVKANENQGIKNAFTKIFLQNIRVYAIDQTIDKAIDGDESRSVAKTISLIVTPAQANRITLAENLGEISLIPRNPDDDKLVDDNEQDVDELFGRSTANNRDQEQGDTSGGALAGFKSMMADALAGAAANAAAQAALPPRSVFEMTIISPNEVSKVQFSANGEPIDPKSFPGGMTSATPPPAAFVAPPAAAPAPTATPAPAPADGAALPPDFPIDLRLN